MFALSGLAAKVSKKHLFMRTFKLSERIFAISLAFSSIYSCAREDGVAHFVAEPYLEPPLVITLSFLEFITVPVVCAAPLKTCQLFDGAFIEEVDFCCCAH